MRHLWSVPIPPYQASFSGDKIASNYMLLYMLFISKHMLLLTCYMYLYVLCGHAGMTLVQVWDIYETHTFPVWRYQQFLSRHRPYRHRRHRPRPQAVWVLLPPTGRTYGPHVPWKQEMGVHSNHPSHETILVLKPRPFLETLICVCVCGPNYIVFFLFANWCFLWGTENMWWTYFADVIC